MRAFFLSGWRAGLRGRAIHANFVVAILLVGMAFCAAAFSPRQPQTVALDVGYSGLRICLVLFALFWVEQLVSREIGSRGILLTLTYPVPRSYYLLARYAAIVALLGVAALILGGMLWGVVAISGRGYLQGFPPQLGLPFWAVVFGFWLDAAVVAAFALVIACVATIPMLPLALGLAFAIGGKTLGAVLDYLARGADGDMQALQMAPVLNVVQWFLPDLSRFDWRVWPMYGVPLELDQLVWVLLMGASYVVILLVLAAQAFARREFA
ncbi:MAG: hypothetical protein K2X64_02990 [Rhodocyclaceae bacterium]|nr:hypothetical protein [Rhodocyclaceae bacterium]